jgi:hypothetical protein
MLNNVINDGMGHATAGVDGADTYTNLSPQSRFKFESFERETCDVAYGARQPATTTCRLVYVAALFSSKPYHDEPRTDRRKLATGETKKMNLDPSTIEPLGARLA